MDKFLKALGPRRLDAAAALLDMDQTEYVASFSDKKNPLAAEREVYDAVQWERETYGGRYSDSSGWYSDTFIENM
jgi:hypothetical protein